MEWWKRTPIIKMSFRILKNMGKFDIQNVIKQTIIPCFFIILLFGIFSNFTNVFGDISCFTSLTQVTDSNYKGGVFVDSYWTDRSSASTQTTNPIKLEVGPGEGPSTLAVVLTNTSGEELVGVKGYLKLPDGYKESILYFSVDRDNTYIIRHHLTYLEC